MVQHEKKRDAASEALIALRTSMGKTQAAFAVEVMKTAVTTIARWETSHAPPPNVVLRLSEIAAQQSLHELRDAFRKLYIDGVLAEIRSAVKAVSTSLGGFMMLPDPTSDDAMDLIAISLDGDDLAAAQSFADIIQIRHSSDPERRRLAKSALRSLRNSAAHLKALRITPPNPFEYAT
jgi:transcriptional regulator with XRE-family HTH domain